ncbi:MAG: tetratricopeptide repeat protein [Anaerolineae bacterium]|nr:tetratricopeptide repeat protein [Anaerolineae bacterium]
MELPDHLRHFTDRSEALAAFDALWSNAGPWVLAFDGLSGNGKTTLLDFIIETRCKPRPILYAILDFEGSRGLTLRTNWNALLETLASQWGLAEHQAYRVGSQAARSRFEAIRRSLQVQIDQKAEQGQITASPITIDATQNEALRLADEQARAETAAALLQAAAEVFSNRPLALFLDTYELLAGAADKAYGGWLWAWLGQAAARLAGLRVIVGSREPLTGLGRRERRQETLPVFEAADSDRLLTSLGVTDPAWRAAVFERLAGGHPLLTEMAADLWRTAQASGLPLPVAAIPSLAGQEQAVEWLTGRILDRLDEPLKTAVRWAALLRRFDQESLAAVLPGETGRLNDEAFERLRRYSFVTPARLGQGWACHDLLRRVQNAYLAAKQPQARREFHLQAAVYFIGQTDEVEALYHRLLAGDETAPDAWTAAVHAAYLRLDWPRWAALLAAAESPELRSPPPLAAQTRFWRYEMDAALASYAQALDLFRAVGSRLGEANTLLTLADMAREQQEWDQAWQHYEQALAMYRTIRDNYSQARALYRMGDWHAAQQQKAAAADCYKAAAAIWSAIGLESLVEQILTPRLKP